ncbi:hypothetical protein FB45DRAFT_997202 [Roridomyces roridus]|uniref:Uncharacterized protein n=1 Tax=Roridomyces roridus TaxID=1738132 RepID=A0AAD7G0V7_9AGAR|nr:hypothetical protein FB45DRAFT_997202 [Roridomyces roridus]
MFFRKALPPRLLRLLPPLLRHTPRTLQPAEVVPVFPRHPVCWWDEYELEVLPFTPANAFANGSLVLAQGPLDVVPVLAQIQVLPSVSFDLASAQLVHTAPATLELAGSHLAGPNIAGFDLPSLDEVEGVFTATLALARLLRHKTGVAWTKLAISLLVLSGMLALDALQFGRARVSGGGSALSTGKDCLCKTQTQIPSSTVLHVSRSSPPRLLKLLTVVAFPSSMSPMPSRSTSPWHRFFSPSLHRPRRNISPTPAPYTRKKKLFKRQRLKAYSVKPQASHGATRSWMPFLLHYRRVIALPFDVPFGDIFHGLFLNGIIVDLLARNIPGVWFMLRSIFPPPVHRVRRTKERYKRNKKKKLP